VGGDVGMGDVIHIGDRVRVRLEAKVDGSEDWFEGAVVRIDPYSEHRSFYWVEFDAETRAILGYSRVSVFNPRNIMKV
jgi:predicted RNA-binding protein